MEERTTATIARLLRQGQWHLLEKLVRLGIPTEGNTSRSDFQQSISDNLIVHSICRFQAPLHIVSLFKETCPESFTTFDAMGRYPLHIACAWGNRPDTIKFLIDSYPVAANTQDFDGRCPIHHLCRTYKLQYQNNECLSVVDSMMMIVQILNSVAPMSFAVEDEDGKNAVEHAVEAEVDMKVIKAVQHACRDMWKEMKKKTTDTLTLSTDTPWV